MVQVAAVRQVPSDLAVVGEAQDVSIPQLCFFAALGGVRPNANGKNFLEWFNPACR